MIEYYRLYWLQVPVVVLEEAILNENNTEKKAEDREKESNNAEEKTEREMEVVVEVVNEGELIFLAS